MAINVVPVTGSGGGMAAPQQGRSVMPQARLNPYVAPQSGIGAFAEGIRPYLLMAMKRKMAEKDRKRRSEAIRVAENTEDLSGLDPDDYLKMKTLQENVQQRKATSKYRSDMLAATAAAKNTTENRKLSLQDNWHNVDDATKRAMGQLSSEDRRWVAQLGYKEAMNVMKMAKEYDMKIEGLKGKGRLELENLRIKGVKEKFERENPVLHRQVMEKMDKDHVAAFYLQDDALRSNEFLQTSKRVWEAGQKGLDRVHDLARMGAKSKYDRLLEEDKITGGINRDKILHQQDKEIKAISHAFTAGQNNKTRTLDQYKFDSNVEYMKERDKLVEDGKTNRHRTKIETDKVMQNNQISWEEKRIRLNQINTQANLKSKHEIDTQLQNNLGKIQSRQSSQDYTQDKMMADTKHVYDKAILQQSIYGEEASDLRKRKTQTLVAHIKSNSKEKVAKIDALAKENKLSKDMGLKLRNQFTKESKEYLRLQSIVSKVNGALKGPQSNASDKIVVQGLLNMIQEAGKGSTKMYKIFEGSGMLGELTRMVNDLRGIESRIPHGQIVDIYNNVWDIWGNAQDLQSGRRDSFLDQASHAGVEDYWITDFNKKVLPRMTVMEGDGRPRRWEELAETVGKAMGQTAGDNPIGKAQDAYRKGKQYVDEYQTGTGERLKSDEELSRDF